MDDFTCSLNALVVRNEATLVRLQSFEALLRNTSSPESREGLKYAFIEVPNSHTLQRQKFFIDHLSSLNCRRFDWTVSDDENISKEVRQGSLSTAAKSMDRPLHSCKLRWKNHLGNSFSTAAWSKNEDVTLVKVVHNHGGIGWSNIASSLDSNRSGLQCFQRYQRSLNPDLASPDFSVDEDSSLTQLVERFASGCWAIVAYELGGGHTPDQCARRWRQVLKPGLCQGRWTPEEDALLSALVRVYGVTRWSEISTFVPGRTDVQARERWHDVLRPGLKGWCPWTAEEDDCLLKAVDIEGVGAWTNISKSLPGRTDHQCGSRYLALAGASSPECERISVNKQPFSIRPSSLPLERRRVLPDDSPNTVQF